MGLPLWLFGDITPRVVAIWDSYRIGSVARPSQVLGRRWAPSNHTSTETPNHEPTNLVEAEGIEPSSKTVGLTVATSVSPVLCLDAALCRGCLSGRPVRLV